MSADSLIFTYYVHNYLLVFRQLVCFAGPVRGYADNGGDEGDEDEAHAH